MATLNISMPDEMRAFIEARVSTGEYQSASDYLRDLIRHDREEIERLLVEGLESGTARPHGQDNTLEAGRMTGKEPDLGWKNRQNR